jgi:curved DNA-binding protein CbpA
MASQRSLYEILNVSPDAELVVIEAAYRALMKKYHPDQSAEAAAGAPSAAEINQAFAVLRDPRRRAGYDRHEWTRSARPVHIAVPAQLPPPRRGGALGWAGWFVALLLGAILFTIVRDRGGLVPPLVNQAEAAAEPDHRSQPDKIEAPMRAAEAGPSAIEREILLRDAAAAVRANEVDRVSDPAEGGRQPTLSLRARETPRRLRAQAVRRVAAKRHRTAEDEEFLSLEGEGRVRVFGARDYPSASDARCARSPSPQPSPRWGEGVMSGWL